MAGKDSISRLKVPLLSFTDKTPTPTRLLKAVDAIGLFGEDEKSSAVSTASSNNPFDETFRKALKTNTSTSKNEEQSDDVLNTPQILSFPSFHEQYSAPPSASVIPCGSKQAIAIAPKDTKRPIIVSKSEQNRLSTLQVPVIKISATSQGQSSQRNTKESNKGSKRCSKSDFDLKERNKAAAKRSRMKKKIATSNMEKTIEKLKCANNQLVIENNLLKTEVLALRAELDEKRNLSSILIVPSSNQILSVKPS